MKGVVISGDRSGSGKTSVTLALAALLARTERSRPSRSGWTTSIPRTSRPSRAGPAGTWTASSSPRTRTGRSSTRRPRGRPRDRRGGPWALRGGRGARRHGLDRRDGEAPRPARRAGRQRPLDHALGGRARPRVPGLRPGGRDRGVILNNVSGPSHRAKAVTAVEHFCGIPVIGAIPPIEEMHLAMRHLGLVPYREGSEESDFRERIETVTASSASTSRPRGSSRWPGAPGPGRPAPLRRARAGPT